MGDALPLALGVAISPIPIIAAIVLMLTPKARVTSVAYLVGLVAGIAIVVSVFAVLSSVLVDAGLDLASSKPAQNIVQLIMGLILLGLGVLYWVRRPRGARQPAEEPGWLQSIDRITMPGAIGLGVMMTAVNPKNLILTAGAGVVIGTAGLAAGDQAVSLLAFTIIGASTVTAVVIAHALAERPLRGPLAAARLWLSRRGQVLVAVVLWVMGLIMVGVAASGLLHG